MNGLFASPFAFIALASLPVLAAIYLFRNRFQSHEVSSLMFWEDRTRVSSGGLQLEKIKTPLLFLIELLVLLMLVVAAAGPLLRSSRDTRVLAVVLDDSFSMLAGQDETARDRAAESLQELLTGSGRFRVTLITAGREPQVLANSLSSISQVRDSLDDWQCYSTASDIPAALALASELGGKTARLLVLTDQPPKEELQDGTVEWRAFGRGMGNLAFVTAVRDGDGEEQKCMLTVANYSAVSRTFDLQIESTDTGESLLSREVTVQGGVRKRIRFSLDASLGPVRALFDDGALDFDNEAHLLPAVERMVSVGYRIENEDLEQMTAKAVDSTAMTSSAEINPAILFTDSQVQVDQLQDTWVMRFAAGEDPNAYVGPFVVNRAHPLTEGLSLDGVIWAGQDADIALDTPVITAGNVPLVYDKQLTAGQHHITINLNPEMSTLAQSPDWPVLFWNLINWRKDQLPGPERTNTGLGYEVAVTFPFAENVEAANVTLPDDSVQQFPVAENRLSVQTRLPGVYRVESDLRSYAFAANPISPAESDLSTLAEGVWGKWQDAEKFWWEYRSIDWLPLIIALVLLSIHRILTSRSSART
ncbi:hypothetical protein STSP2_01630 [Anaerohalosphaera lusitana]|uniref:Aerotolerance regulator N-terminal domain-containing protein n=1 Tax=Anaerohalosphaera lusitana TaxID=1936003 RepID=A0A1U9NLV2_9BACT|nr:VWA domain-containing protein [Anaerohalosphaera lusitana]AQT68466.1 hypothetical protein STSP2_01630 [Anaerohalosphaera lusitana]